MAWTQTDIDTLKAAIASGVLSVTFADRSTTYKSTDDQLKALALMERAINATATYRLASTSKGV